MTRLVLIALASWVLLPQTDASRLNLQAKPKTWHAVTSYAPLTEEWRTVPSLLRGRAPATPTPGRVERPFSLGDAFSNRDADADGLEQHQLQTKVMFRSWPIHYWLLLICVLLCCCFGSGAGGAVAMSYYRRLKTWTVGEEPQIEGIEASNDAQQPSGILGGMIKGALDYYQKGGGLGVAVKVGAIEVNATKGIVTVTDVLVANPEGYWSERMIKADRVSIDIDMSKLIFSRGKLIDVESVELSGVDLIFERATRTSNVHEMLDNLKKKHAKEKAVEKAAAEEAAKQEASGKKGYNWWWKRDRNKPPSERKVVLHKLSVKNIGVKLASYWLMGAGARLAVADIDYEDFEKEATKASMAAGVVPLLIFTVLKSVLATVVGNEIADEVCGDVGSLGESVAAGIGNAAKAVGADVVAGKVMAGAGAIADVGATQAAAATGAAKAGALQADAAFKKGAAQAAVAAQRLDQATGGVAGAAQGKVATTVASAGAAVGAGAGAAVGVAGAAVGAAAAGVQRCWITDAKNPNTLVFNDEDGDECQFELVEGQVQCTVHGRVWQGPWLFNKQQGDLKSKKSIWAMTKQALHIEVPEAHRDALQALLDRQQ